MATGSANVLGPLGFKLLCAEADPGPPDVQALADKLDRALCIELRLEEGNLFHEIMNERD